ncbi:tyrosine-type recombinase/integrase [Paraburkholderia atlantica]|uniref:tyrosine-type recombinase/integrase n=1 Tax=Paraburkholderia atlantica TaxID=2654982 RepID=UPI0016079D76|nr:tyrosine-type recombinase/integrase [Paraburkholderia atlantica]MBB5420665.1 site-specific recombinase XerD [Paraburkholderia atlantica]
MSRQTATSFPGLVQEFFTDYMVQQRALSPRTVASYRDTFVLLLRFAEARLGLAAHELAIVDLNATLLSEFLDHLEVQRHNSVRSRNVRLAAIRAFLKFAARREPASLGAIQSALAVPMKRYDRKLVGFLTREQMTGVINVATDTWIGQRDRLMLTILFNTGARVSEIIGVRVGDVVLGPCSSIKLRGKGRKQRSLPLWKSAAKGVREWLYLNPQLVEDSPLLPTRDGRHMTRANVAQRLQLAVEAASVRYPELRSMKVSPHVVRHTTAMSLLQAGTDACEIALWLGHESPSTTHMYVEADLAMKQRTLARLKQPEARPAVYRPPKALLAFLKSL